MCTNPAICSILGDRIQFEFMWCHCCIVVEGARFQMDAKIGSAYFETAVFGSWLRRRCGRMVLWREYSHRDPLFWNFAGLEIRPLKLSRGSQILSGRVPRKKQKIAWK